MAVLALVTGIAALVSGCGTLCNTSGVWSVAEGGMRPYGGVLTDLDFARDIALDTVFAKTAGDYLSGGGRLVLLLVDLPLSFVGDTLTLPVTVPYYVSWTESYRTSQGDGPSPEPVFAAGASPPRPAPPVGR
jgi:uncharacterized protein YceK